VESCVVIGDIGVDVAAAVAAGARAILVPGPRTSRADILRARRTAQVVPTLTAAVDLALQERSA
jgi:beta-phosphoglucomutase-like phosphatase (HAD superfamily)